MQTPIDALVDWTPVEVDSDRCSDGLPYATHTGALTIAGMELRCYRLNTGEAVIDADDVERFFAGMIE